MTMNSEDEYLSPWHVMRYKGYLTALEDVLQLLEVKKPVREWIKKQVARIKKILDIDRHGKFDYTLKQHEDIFC